MKAGKRARLIERAVKLVADSLDSHLELTHTRPKKANYTIGKKRYHKKCVREYAEVLKILSQLY